MTSQGMRSMRQASLPDVRLVSDAKASENQAMKNTDFCNCDERLIPRKREVGKGEDGEVGEQDNKEGGE